MEEASQYKRPRPAAGIVMEGPEWTRGPVVIERDCIMRSHEDLECIARSRSLQSFEKWNRSG